MPRLQLSEPELHQLMRLPSGSPQINEIALNRLVSSGIPDLTDEVGPAGELPVFVGLDNSIWFGKRAKDTEVAIKVIRSPQNRDSYKNILQEFIREAVLWWHAIPHENVLPILGIASIDNSLALISPWMEGNNLAIYLKTHRHAHVEKLLADVACGLAHLHNLGIVYGILRPTNILVWPSGRACLSSFLLAHTQNEGTHYIGNIMKWRTESLTIAHPETVSSHSRRTVTTFKTDVFDFGSLIAEIFKDRYPPTYSHSASRMNRSGLTGEDAERPKYLESISDDFWSIMVSCWQRKPALRSNMAEVSQRMLRLAETSNNPDIADATVDPELGRPITSTSEHTLRDISSEIQSISEEPFASGGFCDVYLGERLDVEKVALKLIRFSRVDKKDQHASRRRFLSEAWLWVELRHPRILQFYGVCRHGSMAYFMVSPFLKNGNIMEYLENINPNADRRRLILEAAEGLLYLHERYPHSPVVHGDMKGANVLITDQETAVLTDFGLSKINNEATTTMLQGAGSPRWMAPELVLSGDQGSEPLKTVKTDVYAFGYVMLEVLSGQLPFFTVREDIHVLVQIIQGNRSPRPVGPAADTWLDDETWALILRYSAIDPYERPSMRTVVSDLRRGSREA